MADEKRDKLLKAASIGVALEEAQKAQFWPEFMSYVDQRQEDIKTSLLGCNPVELRQLQAQHDEWEAFRRWVRIAIDDGTKARRTLDEETRV
jgi:hypothetical protein